MGGPDVVAAGWAAEADVVCDGVDEVAVVADACSGSLSCLKIFLSLSIVRVCKVGCDGLQGTSAVIDGVASEGAVNSDGGSCGRSACALAYVITLSLTSTSTSPNRHRLRSPSRNLSFAHLTQGETLVRVHKRSRILSIHQPVDHVSPSALRTSGIFA